MNLAVLRIQKMWRGVKVRKQMAGRLQPVAKASLFRKHTVQTYVKYMEATGESHRDAKTGVASERFMQWCACMIQRAWRRHRQRRLTKYHSHPMYHLAAVEVQRYYRAWRRQAGNKFKSKGLLSAVLAVECIQRIWRAFTSRRIYRYFRDLIIFRQNSDPVTLVKCLNPKESGLVDPSSGVYVRFRLGGTSFPPMIYYKMYTSQSVTDINAFAPRDYNRERQNRINVRKHTKNQNGEADQDPTNYAYWYKRWENNGWRPISDKLLIENDEIVETSAAKRIDFHYSKLVRQVDLLKKRKKKKLQWLKKMYSDGNGTQAISQKSQYAAEVEQLMETLNNIDEKSEEVFDKDWEDQADELLTWSKGLDYEAYQDTWFVKATSRPANKGYYDDFSSESDNVSDVENTNSGSPGRGLAKATRLDTEFDLDPSDWDGGPRTDRVYTASPGASPVSAVLEAASRQASRKASPRGSPANRYKSGKN